MNKLFKAQAETVTKLLQILQDYDGAILRADEGTGKTVMAAAVAQALGMKTLFVGNAFAKKDVESKLAEYREWGIEADITCVSYHMFGNIAKFDPKEYGFIIFDECHMLRNWSNKWTQRFVYTRNKKFLFMSGTPMIKSPKDFMYIVRRTGAFEGSTKGFKVKYFNAQPSKFGDFLELGEFQNELDFQIRLDKVCVELRHRHIDKTMPGFDINVVNLEGDYEEPVDITEETNTRVKTSLIKTQQAGDYIRDKLIQGPGLVLCQFHETAKEVYSHIVHDHLELVLKPSDVGPAFKRAAKNNGIVVTTLGLTQSSFDFNECDNVFLVDSTYSFALDRQSIRRCQRIGKKNRLNVTYFALEGERPLITSMSRRGLTERFDGKTFSPSQLAIWEKCPGSFWIEDEEEKPDFLIRAAERGNHNHKALELCLKNPNEPVPESVEDTVRDCIAYCRERIHESDEHGVEERVYGNTIHPNLRGMIDFWSYDRANSTLLVLDYKNGKTEVPVEDNLQLLTYAYMLCDTKKFAPDRISLGIFQRDNLKMDMITYPVLRGIEERIRNIIERILAAEKEPLKHLNEGECSFFCSAKKYHKKEEDMKNFTPKQKLPRHQIEGKVFFTRDLKTKAGATYRRLGISVADVPASLLEKYPADSTIGKQLKGKSDKDAGVFYLFNEDESNGGFTVWLNLFADYNTGELTNIGQNDIVKLQCIAKETVSNGEVKLFLNIKETEVTASEPAPESVEY